MNQRARELQAQPYVQCYVNDKKEPEVTVGTRSFPSRENSKCKGPEVGVKPDGPGNTKAPGLRNCDPWED